MSDEKQDLADEFTREHPEAVRFAVDAADLSDIVDREPVDPIVCPYCGMSTWVHGRCALPGCEGHA